METLAVIISLIMAWAIGAWLGYFVSRDITRQEAIAIVMRSQNDVIEREWTANERLAMIKAKSFIISKMEEKWLRQ